MLLFSISYYGNISEGFAWFHFNCSIIKFRFYSLHSKKLFFGWSIINWYWIDMNNQSPSWNWAQWSTSYILIVSIVITLSSKLRIYFQISFQWRSTALLPISVWFWSSSCWLIAPLALHRPGSERRNIVAIWILVSDWTSTTLIVLACRCSASSLAVSGRIHLRIYHFWSAPSNFFHHFVELNKTKSLLLINF